MQRRYLNLGLAQPIRYLIRIKLSPSFNMGEAPGMRQRFISRAVEEKAEYLPGNMVRARKACAGVHKTAVEHFSREGFVLGKRGIVGSWLRITLN